MAEVPKNRTKKEPKRARELRDLVDGINPEIKSGTEFEVVIALLIERWLDIRDKEFPNENYAVDIITSMRDAMVDRTYEPIPPTPDNANSNKENDTPDVSTSKAAVQQETKSPDPITIEDSGDEHGQDSEAEEYAAQEAEEESSIVKNTVRETTNETQTPSKPVNVSGVAALTNSIANMASPGMRSGSLNLSPTKKTHSVSKPIVPPATSKPPPENTKPVPSTLKPAKRGHADDATTASNRPFKRRSISRHYAKK